MREERDSILTKVKDGVNQTCGIITFVAFVAVAILVLVIIILAKSGDKDATNIVCCDKIPDPTCPNPTNNTCLVTTSEGGYCNSETFIKKDGEECTSNCFDPDLEQTCLNGVCTGTCLGNCDTGCDLLFEVDEIKTITTKELKKRVKPMITSACPSLLLINDSIPMFSFCAGMCVYSVSLFQFCFIYQEESMPLDFTDQLCRDIISDDEPLKNCLNAKAILSNWEENDESSEFIECRYWFKCAKIDVSSIFSPILL